MPVLVETSCLDQEIFDHSLAKRHWRVHSKFAHSFNIQDETRQYLAVIASEQKIHVPNGIYLSPSEFKHLAAEVQVDDCLLIQGLRVKFPQRHLLLTTRTYQSFQKELSADRTDAVWDRYVSEIKKVKKETGNHEPLAAVFTQINDFIQAIDRLCTDKFSMQRSGLQFLIGRGPGLTPTGDDMIIGHLAARLLLGRRNQKLERYLRNKIMAVTDLTTDVSKHYLLCSIDQRFNQSVLQLITEFGSNAGQISKRIQAVLATGHTSGADFLAGFTRTIHYFKEENHGK
ncbi:DUF2877 domain-containing protein [Candidatus Enterococcus ferrettii]|uniref:DUF2877 domain-containing protein n=1 Tax=Candidatus Enterococcus ferrettii TaxID=2815324 RepID=A0ABV0EYS5_9ENTE|nr:DUF2877 domain-containing protein [Enterococcus sp. 665A]